MSTEATVSGDLTDGAPTGAALEADHMLRVVPEGVTDCGTVTLTSGWPTTTAFLPEMSASCVIEAAEAGQRAQQSFNGRDNHGGLTGTILIVNGPGDVVEATYTIDPAGEVESVEHRCNSLPINSLQPPTCAD